MAKKKKRGGYKKTLGACAVVAFILAALGLDIGGFGSGMGLGLGLPTINTDNAVNAVVEVFAPATQVEDQNVQELQATIPQEIEDELESAQVSLTITISGDYIIYDEQRITKEELEQLLIAINQPYHIWELQDNQAIMATYNDVRMLLIESNIRFEESLSN